MNITLIGMPGSGKSHIGKKLAERLNYNFIDTDIILENEYGIPIKSIIDKLGENVFLKKQEEYTISCTNNISDTVISTGGSIIYTDEVMYHLKKNSLIIYLIMPLEVIKERMVDSPRSIVDSKDKDLEKLYEERTFLYNKWSSKIVDANQDSEMIVDNILKIIGNKSWIK